ncbi:MAG: periplasmic heavy metal sensor [Acidobacteria bacterium]|nr:periplasmic heavy metal sensor [Acidobacteriota bacterium]
MKRHTSRVFSVLLLPCLMGATVYAQTSQEQPQQQELQRRLRQAEQLIIQSNQFLQARSPQAGLRGGGRGGAAVGAWWTNAALVERLGLTDDQKLRIERAFENHRLKIVSNTDLLGKEEAQLAGLLEAETIDRNAILTQIDRITADRGELERENAAMTLEMREVLTRAQWMQLPQQSNSLSLTTIRTQGGRTGGPRETAPAPPAPGQGGRRGGRSQE